MIRLPDWITNHIARSHARIASAAEERALRDRWHWGYAIRRDWDDGTHCLSSFRSTRAHADRIRARTHRWWNITAQPRTVTIVAVNRHQVRTHYPPFCRSPLCPTTSVGDTQVTRT